MDMTLAPKKFKNEEIITFIRDIVAFENTNELGLFFLDSARSELTSNELIKKYFPDNLIIYGYERSLFYDNISYLLFKLRENHIIVNWDIYYEMIYTSGLTRMDSPDDYFIWLEIISFRLKNIEMDVPLMEYIDFQDFETNKEFFVNVLNLDEFEFDQYYADFYEDSLYDAFYNILIGNDFMKSTEYLSIKSKCKTFEDEETLKEINKILIDFKREE